MEKITLYGLKEVLFASSDKAESRKITAMLKTGKIRKIATRVYTTNLTDEPEWIVKRNFHEIVGHLFPKAVISHRSAFEFNPTPQGHFYLTYNYTRNYSLPGVTIHLLEGPSGSSDDKPFIAGLFMSRQERAFLENLQPSRSKGEESKVLGQAFVERKLEEIIVTQGEDALNELRDKTRNVADELGMQTEFKKLDKIIGALLSTREASALSSPVALARASGLPYDPNRLDLFHNFFVALQQQTFPYIEDKNVTAEAYRAFASFESYFSNYIEGTEFEIQEALEILRTNSPIPTRDEDSHDVLGTFYIVSNRSEMATVPTSANELLEILQARHRVIMAARPSAKPGVFKSKNNRAGETHFVDWTLVRGTLIKGFDFYNALEHPFAKALFMMFMISEVHPFNDGNGRMSRIMMNAELTHAGQAKIIIPTVFRDDYIGALRRLTRKNDPSVIIRAMQRIQRFSATLYGNDIDDLMPKLIEANAFKEPDECILNFNG